MKIPKIPEEIYKKHGSQTQQILNQKIPLPITEKIDYTENGIFCYEKGFLHPSKTFTDTEKYQYINDSKRYTIELIRIFAVKEILLCLSLLILIPWKRKLKILERFLTSYCLIVQPKMKQTYLEDKYYSKPTKALKALIENFFEKLGISVITARHLGNICRGLIEADPAYRYRMEDILSETDAERLKKKPVREVRRLVKLFAKRSGSHHTTDKFVSAGRLMAFALLHPKVKRAFREALDTVEWQDLCLDEADRYHVLRFDQYEYMGRTIEDRWAEFLKLHGGVDGLPEVHYVDFTGF